MHFFFRLNYVDNYNKLYILSVARLAETPIKYRDWEFRRMVSMHGEVRMVLILAFKQLLNTKVCYNMLLKLL